jgi:hypothetical protein
MENLTKEISTVVDSRIPEISFRVENLFTYIVIIITSASLLEYLEHIGISGNSKEKWLIYLVEEGIT